MKTYQGIRGKSEAVVAVITAGVRKELNPRLDIRNHSPTGFEWGYGGSGPAQLALAILADYLGDDRRAQDLCQNFKVRIVASLDQDSWKLSGADIEAALFAGSSPEI